MPSTQSRLRPDRDRSRTSTYHSKSRTSCVPCERVVARVCLVVRFARAHLIVSALLLSACAHNPATVTRVIEGQQRAGIFVSPYAYEHFVRAELEAARGNDVAAVREYRMARTGPSDDAFVIARMAEALERSGSHEAADRALEEGDALDERSEAIALARATIAMQRDNLDVALRQTVRAAEYAPESEAPILLLAQLLERMDAGQRAGAVLERAGNSSAALRARVTSAIRRHDSVAAADALEHLLRVAPVRADEIRTAARLALQEGRPALAVHLLEHLADVSVVAAREPSAPSAPALSEDAALRVRALLASGRHEEAEGLLRFSAPEVFGGVGAHAALLLEARLFEDAARAAESAYALGDIEALVVLGHARLALGDAPGAAAAFARVPSGARGAGSARTGLRDALRMGGLPTVADELEPR